MLPSFPARTLRLALLSVPLLVFLVAGPFGPAAAHAGGAGGGVPRAHAPAGAQVPGGAVDPHAQHAHQAGGVDIPSLLLTWGGGAKEAPAGVPVALSIQALDAGGMADRARSGAALLLVDDALAQVTAGQADLSGAPVSTGQRVTVALRSGKAEVTITFATPGVHKLLANVREEITIAGESDRLHVRDTFLVIRGGAHPKAEAGQASAAEAGATRTSAGPAGRQRFTVEAQDERGQPVPGFTGRIVVSTSDPGAVVEPAAGGEQLARGIGGQRLSAVSGGRAAFDITFVEAGEHTITASHGEAPSRRGTLKVAVGPGSGRQPAAGATPAATGTATASPSRTPVPARPTTTTPTASATARATPQASATRSDTTPAAPPAPTATSSASGATTHDHQGAAVATVAPLAVLLASDRTGTTADAPTGGVVHAKPDLQSSTLLDTTGSLDSADPTFDRPNAAPGYGTTTSCSASGTLAHYDTYTITHPGGQLTIDLRGSASSGGTLGDPELALYSGSFSGTATCTNFVAYDSDSGAGADARIQLAVDAGTYVIVATTWSSGTGSYHVTAVATPLANTTSFSVTPSVTSTHAGVPLTVTVTALTSSSTTDTNYRGTVQLSSTDAAFAPGTVYRYTFTATDSGQHAFAVTFNTAGAAQTITVTDTVASTTTGTAPP